jgi:hypothetical protein
MVAISYPVLLAGPFELGSSVSHFHYNYHETDMIAHMGHKVCLNVGSVVLARSWLLSGGKPMPAAALISKLGSKAREMYTSMRYDHMCGFVCCNHTRYTEYIVINRQQPRQWHHSGFVVQGRSFVKTSADREPRRPFVHYAELRHPRQMGIYALEAFCFCAINSFNTLSTPSTTTPHSVSWTRVSKASRFSSWPFRKGISRTRIGVPISTSEMTSCIITPVLSIWPSNHAA